MSVTRCLIEIWTWARSLIGHKKIWGSSAVAQCVSMGDAYQKIAENIQSLQSRQHVGLGLEGTIYTAGIVQRREREALCVGVLSRHPVCLHRPTRSVLLHRVLSATLHTCTETEPERIPQRPTQS
jgi:hypothetical protein